MKKIDRLKSGPMEFDDLDFSMDELDFGESNPKDRSPAKTIRKAVKSAATAHYTNENTIRRLVGKALPKEYGDAFDTYTKGRETIREAVSDFKGTMREPVNEFAKILKNKTPANLRRTHKFLDFMEESTRSYKSEKFDKAAEENKAIEMSLQEMFAAQDDVRQSERERDEARANIEKTAELVRFKSHTNILNSIARSVDVMAKNTVGITQAYQKKSLELQYRMVFGIKDTNEQLRLLIAQNRAQLEQIRHNTGLPEAQKIQLSERFKNTIKNKFVGSTLGKFTEGDNVFTAAAGQFSKSLKQMGEQMAGALGMANMGLGMDFDLDPTEDPVEKRRRQITEFLTTQGLGEFDDMVVGKAKKMTRGNRKVSRTVRKGASNIKNLLQNGDAELRNFALGGDLEENAFMQALRGLAAMAAPSRDTDRKIKREAGGEALKQPAELDNAYKRSITEVMPGYLARILQELQITRTGNAKVGLTYFDYDKGSFASKNDLIKKYEKQFSDKQGANEPMSELIAAIAKAGGNLNEDAQTRLKKSMLKARVNGAGMTPAAMTREGFWKNTGSQQDAGAVAEAMRKFFDSQEAGKFSNTNRARNSRDMMLDAFSAAEEKMRDPRADIQYAYDQGHGDIIRSMGFTDDDDKGTNINIDKIIDNALAASGVTKADLVGNDGGASLQPDQVLKNLKKSSTKGRQLKRGTMYSGAVPASGAAELAAIGGAAIAGIQGLQSRLDKELGEGGGSHLAKLVGVSERSYGVLTMIAEALEKGRYMSGAMAPAPTGGMMGGIAQYAGEKAATLSEKAGAFATDTKERVKGFWNSTMGENMDKFKDKLRAGWKRGKAVARLGFRVGKKTADVAVDQASKSRLFGARMFQDLKDGIPTVGDLFVGSEKQPRINAAGLEAGIYFDVNGKVLTTLMAIADAVEGVFDENNNQLISPSELKKAYVKSNAKIFARVFSDRVMRAAARLTKGVGNLLNVTGRTALFAKRKLGIVGNFGKALAKEILMPPRDVYVVGETTPRLLAHVMRLGGYLNKVDGSVIEHPIKIKGEVVNLAGEILISNADLSKGLVDENGQPFRSITQRLADGLRKRVTNAARTTAWIAGKAKSTAQTLGKGVKTFVTKGLSGFKDLGGPGGGGNTVQIAAQSHSVLEQIRDILDARLPGGGMGGAVGNIMTPKGPDGSNGNGNAPAGPGEPARANRDYDGGTNIFSMGANMVGKGVSAAAGAFSRWRAKRKGLSGLASAPGTGADGAEVKEAVKDSQTKTTREIESLKKENKSLFKRIAGGAKEKFSNAKARFTGAAAAAGAGAKGAKGDADGDGLRDNSWQDLKNKQRNINEPTKDLSDVQRPGDMGTENTIDMLLNMFKSKLGLGAAAASGLDDLLDGPDGRRDKNGKAPRGKVPPVPPGGKKGIFRRAGGYAVDTAKKYGGKALQLGKGLFRSGAGAVARAGGARAVAMGVGRFALTRALPAALGGIAAVLGAPFVGTALTIAGAAWGLKELYDLVKGDDKKEVAKHKNSGNLRALRMAEYGVSMGDAGPTATLQWLEDYLYPNVKVDEGKASIDEAKIDAREIVSRFRIDLDNEAQLSAFSRWLERRFKPNFFKHAAAAKTAGLKSMADIDTLKPSNALAFYKAVTQVSEGHDELANPFGSGNDLQVTAQGVRDLKEVLGKLLEEKASKESKDEKLAKETSPGDLKRKDVSAAMGTIKAEIDGGPKAGQQAMDKYIDQRSNTTKLEAYQNDKTKNLDGMMVGGITYATSNIEALPSASVTALASIRYRLYGLSQVQTSKVAALNGLEAHAQKFVSLSSNGVATFNGAPEKVFDFVRGLFGVPSNDAKGTEKWINWFQNRFLPIFTTYYAQACFHTDAKDLAAATAALTPAQSEAVANAMMALAGQVMKVSTSPWPGYLLSSTITSIQPFQELLKERAEKQTLSEEKVKAAPSTDTPTRAPGMMQTAFTPRPSSPANTKPAFQANVLPDMETDAKSAAGSGGGSATKPEGAGARAPSTGSLKKAEGELMNGAGAEAFLKYHNGATLDGANPEAAKLFRGMVEEYGTITGKKIQLNAGKRSFDDQQREYANNPRNAARPGSSLHEFGLAFDINSADANALEKLGLMRKYGFTRPVGGEPWHIEPAGIQDNVNKYKKDGMAATMAVSYSPGKGGGGVGVAKGLYAHGRRNTEHALALFNAGSETVKTEDREGGGSRSAGVPSMTAKGGYAGSAAQVGGEVTAMGTAGAPKTAGGSGGGAIPDFEGSPKLKSGSETRAQGQAALNNYEGKGGGYNDLKGGGGGSVSDMKKLVADAAQQVGVDPNLAMTTVAVESSFKAGAAAGTSSAKGLYQFTGGTWNDMLKKHGQSYGIPADAKPTDPKANAIMGALYLKQNLQTAQKAGMPQNALSAYLLHFLGPAGGRRFMSLGDDVTPAHAMPEAAAANKSIFFNGGRPRTKQEIMELLQNKLTKTASAFGIGTPDMGATTQVAKAGGPAANDAVVTASDTTSASTPSTPVSSGAPTMQNALYKPTQEAPPKPKPVVMSSGAPSFTPTSLRPVMQRDQADTQVGSMGSAQKALMDSIVSNSEILGQQLTVQRQILEAVMAVAEAKGVKAPDAAPGASSSTTVPDTPRPDRSSRRVSEPVIDTRRVA